MLTPSHAKDMFVFFSKLIDKRILDSNGTVAGELYDIIVKPTEVYPAIIASDYP